MSISVTNAQGTQVWIADTANAAISTYADFDDGNGGGVKASSKQIGCIQDIGSLSETKAVQEYTCLSSDESTKATGSTKRGNFTVSMLFDALDAAGQAELRSLFATDSTRTLVVQLNDNAGTSPTIIVFDGFVSGQEIAIQKDNAVMINSTVEIASAINTINAAA